MKKLIYGAVALGFAAVTMSAGVAMAGDVAAGEAKFQKKCAVCHDTGAKKKMGPGLQGVTSRHGDEWMTKWLTDPQAVWEAGDAEVEELKARVGKTGKKKTAMKVRGLKGDDVANIIAYLHKL